MSREDPQLRIRLPIELKNEIELLASKNNRSVNSEIVHAIEFYLKTNNTPTTIEDALSTLKTDIIVELNKYFNISPK